MPSNPHWDNNPLVQDMRAHQVREFDGTFYFWMEVPGNTPAFRELVDGVWAATKRMDVAFAQKLGRAVLPDGIKEPEGLGVLQ